jgi:transcription antitermination factor NusG
MTTREKAHALLDELSDAELDDVVKLIEVRHDQKRLKVTHTAPGHVLVEMELTDDAWGTADREPEMAELPEGWRTFEDGTPVPNWVAAVHEAREGR